MMQRLRFFRLIQKLRKRTSDNRGASIIMVVIGCVFVMTLGTIIISAALRNIEMKAVDRNSKKNFYSAEAALEEIKINIAETVSDNLATAYHTILTKYSATDEASRVALFQSTFVDQMKIKLQVQVDVYSLQDVVPMTLLNSYLEESKLESGIGAEVITAPKWKVLGDGIVLENLMVKYQAADYVTTLSTDIKIKFPNTTFGNSGGYFEQLVFQHYSVIADEHLLVNLGTHEIKGNVYAGLHGIDIENPNINIKLDIYDGTVISAGNITVKDKGWLGIHSPLNEIWASNLITNQSNKAEEKYSQTTLKIYGRSYIQDDLIIDSKRSDVTFGGEYYGFSSGSGPENNSAIMINARNAALNLSGLSKLTLAGRAFVNLNNLSDPSLGGSSNIQTGESLAVKGSQNSYLLPEEYIAVGHNPVTWSEYRHYITLGTGMVTIPLDAKIFQHTSISEEESKLHFYLNPTEPVKKAFYKFDTSLASDDSNVVYYYLNFRDEELATTYFKNFCTCYPDEIYINYPLNQIILNNTPGAVVTSGNLMTFDGTDIGVMAGNNGVYLNNHKTEYENLCHTLQKNISGTGGVFANIIEGDAVVNDGLGNGGVAYEVTSNLPTEYMVVVKDGDYTLSESNKFGLIIATGDVDVNQSFRGLIISGKEIALYSDAKLEADSSLILQIIAEHPRLHPYFQELSDGSATTPGGWNAIKAADLIVYENWRKN